MFPSIQVPQNLTARDRGQFYGQAARAQTLHSRNTYARLFASCGISWAQACDKAMAYREVIEQLDPALLLEMEGIAQGCGLTLPEIMALNCRTEILPANFLSDATHQADAALQANRAAGLPDWLGDSPVDPAAADGECTAMAVAPGASCEGNTWLAQNWDWLGRQREALVLLHSGNEAGQRFTTLTEGGMLAKIGMNTQGFALGLNILRSLQDGVRPGVPVHVLLRHLLGCGSLGAARAELTRIGQSLGFGAASNVPCADAQGKVACFEVAPAGWGEVPPAQGVVVHTNHFVCASLLSTQAPMGVTLSSQPRLLTAQQHAAQGRIDQTALEHFLRDATDGHLSICRSPDMALPPEGRVESVAGVIMNTTTRQMWIAPDVPSRCAFEPVALPH